MDTLQIALEKCKDAVLKNKQNVVVKYGETLDNFTAAVVPDTSK